MFKGFCVANFLSLLSLVLRNVTFYYKRSSLSYFGGVCSVSKGVGVNEVTTIVCGCC